MFPQIIKENSWPPTEKMKGDVYLLKISKNSTDDININNLLCVLDLGF